MVNYTVNPLAGAPPLPAAAAPPADTLQGAAAAGEFDPAPPPPPPTALPGSAGALALSAKEWGCLKAAVAAAPQLQAAVVGEDGKVGVPRGWVKLVRGGGFAREADGRVVEHIGDVVDALLEEGGH